MEAIYFFLKGIVLYVMLMLFPQDAPVHLAYAIALCFIAAAVIGGIQYHFHVSARRKRNSIPVLYYGTKE